MANKNPPVIDGELRKFSLRVPPVIRECSGIVIFGKRIKSLVFSTDLCIIRNVNADAIIAVYPFTPQTVIIDALMMAADIPVFAGIGGGLTQGSRVSNLAQEAESQGAMGVVVNGPTANETIRQVSKLIEIPVVTTVVNRETDYAARIEAGTAIFNVAAAGETPAIVREIRSQYPNFPIMATGGPTDESILATIAAGANAITWTPPSNAAIFKDIMDNYRKGLAHP
jgi:2-keto-3-deoxy-6-phosphogluconate aldolase